MAAFDQFITAGVDMAFYGTIDTDGYLKGGTDTAPVPGATVSPMLRLKGMVSADVTVAEPEVVNVPGDNASQGSFTFGPETTPSFTLEKSVFDLALTALAQGTLVFADGDINLGVLQPSDVNSPDLCWILQSPAKKKNIGQNGLKAWTGYIIPLAQAFPLGRTQYQTRAAATDRMRISTSPVGMLFDGLAIDDTNLGTTGAPLVPFTSDYPIYFVRATGNGVITVYTLPYPIYSAASVRVRVNGVLLVLTTDYTVNLVTREITFVAAPAASAKIVIRAGIA